MLPCCPWLRAASKERDTWFSLITAPACVAAVSHQWRTWA